MRWGLSTAEGEKFVDGARRVEPVARQELFDVRSGLDVVLDDGAHQTVEGVIGNQEVLNSSKQTTVVDERCRRHRPLIFERIHRTSVYGKSVHRCADIPYIRPRP
ncbi:MAG TPA: hypothetical protein VFN92_05775 [Solirubrobacterales bacterium]|nr:hypothetical protein [Solirubrobacterales bacterium]